MWQLSVPLSRTDGFYDAGELDRSGEAPPHHSNRGGQYTSEQFQRLMAIMA
jgi:hypothetical protein